MLITGNDESLVAPESGRGPKVGRALSEADPPPPQATSKAALTDSARAVRGGRQR